MTQEFCTSTLSRDCTTANRLTGLWESLFKKSPIRHEDNFFQLGGTPALANALFERIASECGREFSPLTIYQAPTINALASILDTPELPKFPPLVRLRSGSKREPVFLVHGMGGSVMEFFQFAEHTTFDRPIYAFHRKGIDGWDIPFSRVEDLAAHCVTAIREIQPRGPYYLAGFSLGGLIALEIAQQIRRDGHDVAFLGVIETFPHWKYLAWNEKAKISWSLAKRLRDKILHRARIIDDEGGDKCQAVGDFPRIGPAFAPIMARSGDCDVEMWKQYRPRHYPGKIDFFLRSEGGAKFPKDPKLVWSPLSKELVVETVPGDHLGVLSQHFAALAAAFSRRVSAVRASED
jgi:thioesterase domain-containing protein